MPQDAPHASTTDATPWHSHLTQPPFVWTGDSSSSSSSSSSSPTIDDALTRDFATLQHLTQDEVQLLLNDDVMFDAVVNTLPQAMQLHQQYEQRLCRNIDIARKNDDMRPQLEQLRTETAHLFNEANELKQRWALLQQAQTEAYKRFTPANQLSRLSKATSNQEHLSEQILNQFLNSFENHQNQTDEFQNDDEQFVKQYKQIRKIYHRRSISLEKWSKGKVVWRT
ncbi:hypothetical protein OIO90_003149 [Microbotryomycetes sp. JL221]|nr:hypothetical protein OIO90_003149 [Microbotryomycetes sp. JL221]